MPRSSNSLPAVFAAIMACWLAAMPAAAQGVLTVAMTAGDLPTDTGIPDQGFEGLRFVGWTLYDALVEWDLSRGNAVSDLKPGLATDWHIDPADPRRWIFSLRHGVRFHDGCAFTADDVLWNFARFNDPASPQFYPPQYAAARQYFVNYDGIEKIDDFTIAIRTKQVESLFPYAMSYVPLIGRCRAQALHYDWTAYADAPSGTGPYRFLRMVPHERMEFTANKDYWDPDRVPRQDRLVLLPMPEPATRVAALLAGQVNFIEAPPPDAVEVLKRRGVHVVSNDYPHSWVYTLNFTKGPFADLRIRQAANYAIDRAQFVALLHGLATEEYAQIPPTLPYYGHPRRYDYDPAKAKALLTEAGCSPCVLHLAMSTSGSGQMQPLPMNELLKSQLDAVGFQVDFQVMDWNALIQILRGGVGKYPDLDGWNGARALMDPANAIIKPVGREFWSPFGMNWGHYSSAEAEELIRRIDGEFDPDKRLILLTRLNELESEDATSLFVVHDMEPRAFSAKVEGYVEAQSWFQDLTRIRIAP